MINVLLKLIEQLNISVFLLLLLLVLVGWFLFKFGGWIKEHAFHKERIEKIEMKSDAIIALSTKVDLIYKIVTPNATMRPSSPMGLTDVGQEISTTIRIQEIFERIKDKFIDEFIKQNKNKNAFEIQQNSIEWAKNESRDYLTKDEIKRFDDTAYQKGLLPEDIYSILGLLLRDEVFRELEITLSEVDRHDINNS